MRYIDIHAHMVSRSTDDYAQMALAGCVALTEPVFWPGWNRRSLAGFADYFDQLTRYEPRRAAGYRIRHYAWLGLNPAEAENRELALAILARIPALLDRPNVLGIGGVGLNRVTRNELESLKDHVDCALDHDQLLMVQTPPLEEKYRGTRLTVETLAGDGRVDAGRVLIDGVEEHTVAMVLDHGFWASIALGSVTRTSPQRAVDLVERHGADRVCLGSACDWQTGTPLAIPEFILEMRRRGHDDAIIRRVVLDNAARFLGQSPNFRLDDPAPGARVDARADQDLPAVAAGAATP